MKHKGSSPLVLVAVILIIAGAAMAGAGVLLPGFNVKLPSLSSVSSSGVPIDISFAGACYAGQPFAIHAYISEPNIGPPVPIGGAALSFSVRNASNNGLVTSGTATSDAFGAAAWVWQSPIPGNYILSVDWAGDANHTSGAHVGNIPLGVALPPSTPNQQNQTVTPSPYLKYVNIMTLPGLILIIVGAVALPASLHTKKGHK